MSKDRVSFQIVLVFGVVLAALRVLFAFLFEPEPATWMGVYKDVAHLFMGGLGTAWYLQRREWQWELFWMLNLVEVVVAVASRVF